MIRARASTWLAPLGSHCARGTWWQYGSRGCLELHMGSRPQSIPVTFCYLMKKNKVLLPWSSEEGWPSNWWRLWNLGLKPYILAEVLRDTCIFFKGRGVLNVLNSLSLNLFFWSAHCTGTVVLSNLTCWNICRASFKLSHISCPARSGAFDVRWNSIWQQKGWIPKILSQGSCRMAMRWDKTCAPSARRVSAGIIALCWCLQLWQKLELNIPVFPGGFCAM